MDEFDFIKKYLAPLSQDGLSNDGAVLDIPTGKQVVVTSDTLVEGIHVENNTSLADVLRKALRVNLSDLAALGATPFGYSLMLSLPGRYVSERLIGEAVQVLKKENKQYGCVLLGGDTTSTMGTLTVSISMLGLVEPGKVLPRNAAKPNDIIVVSGSIGLGGAGLSRMSERSRARYMYPEPRLTLGQKLVDIATSCIDISDGLLADTLHLLNESGCGASLFLDDIPTEELPPQEAISAGDDYELLFTMSEKAFTELQAAVSVPLTVIGYCEDEPGLRLWKNRTRQQPITVKRLGYKHLRT